MQSLHAPLQVSSGRRAVAYGLMHWIASWALVPLALAAGQVRAADRTDPYDVVWTTPSVDAAGSMPMGNGEVGINLWVAEDGSLNFYISRSDAFSEIGRLLKIGQVRVTLSPNPFAVGRPFRQRLHLRDGVCEIAGGDGANRVTFRVFVDAEQPVVHVAGESASPVTVMAEPVRWRTAPRQLPTEEMRSAWSVHDAPFPLVESADVDVRSPAGTLAWCHRDETSVVPSTIQVQSLGPIAQAIHDPLLNRTFGGWMAGDGFVRTADAPGHATGLRTESTVQAFDLRVAAPCVQSADASAWTRAATVAAARSSDGAAALRRTADWWHGFLDRSWVVTNGGTGIRVPSNRFPLRVGVDANGQNTFPGALAGTAVYNRPLSPDEIGQLARAGHDRPAPLPADAAPEFSHGFTLSAWIKSDRLVDGRIFDKVTAGGTDGFLFDTHPGNTLRLIVGDMTLQAPVKLLTAGTWHHAAATVDAGAGSLRLYLDGAVVAEQVPDGISPISRSYTLQRYVQACGGRGAYPIKFNGGIFTVEPKGMGQPFNADYRAWGEDYWWQNTRHMYHPMLAAGDTDMMDPLFRLYEAVRPVCEGRAELYHHAQGCYFPETMTPWGTYSNGDYGWDRTGQRPEDVLCPYWQFAWNQGPELVGLLLDRWDYTADPAFLRRQVLPMAESVLRYFDARFKRDAAGRIVLDPTQSVETFWSGVVNDMPTTAGLVDITRRLCDLAPGLTTPAQRAFFARMKTACPEVPLEAKTVAGKTVRQLAPAARYAPQRSNYENPELYAVWPFRLFGVGKPGLDEAVAAYDRRANHLDVGWGPDGNAAALLGLSDEASRILQVKCNNSRHGYRWPATWGPNYDWLPDQNHGGNLLETTQLMLLQCDGRKIRVLPAWPKDWDVSFKLHATGNTVVECVYQAGKIRTLTVEPASRRRDVLVPEQ
jgi:hypothetical protein